MAEEPPKRRMVRPPTGGLEGGRSKPARLKTAKQRTASSQAWLERQGGPSELALKHELKGLFPEAASGHRGKV